jgi:hypothetical protein
MPFEGKVWRSPSLNPRNAWADAAAYDAQRTRM